MEKTELSTKVLFLASLIDNRIAENDDDRQAAMVAEKRLKARLRAVLHQPTTAALSHGPSQTQQLLFDDGRVDEVNEIFKWAMVRPELQLSLVVCAPLGIPSFLTRPAYTSPPSSGALIVASNGAPPGQPA